MKGEEGQSIALKGEEGNQLRVYGIETGVLTFRTPKNSDKSTIWDNHSEPLS